MACPSCGCKVAYPYDDPDDLCSDENAQRCAACGTVFDIEDSTDEDDHGQDN